MNRAVRTVSPLSLFVLCVSVSLWFVPHSLADMQQIFTDWRQRQHLAARVRYAVTGENLVPAGRFSPPGTPVAERLPREDHLSPLHVKWLFDFEKGWFSKKADEDVFDVTGQSFHPQQRINLFDGTRVKLYLPQATDRAVPQPELTLEPDAALPLVFTGFDYPLFFAHGSFPTPRTPFTVGQLRLPLEADQVHIHGEGIQDGRPCLILRTTPTADGPPLVDEYWIDKAHGSAVLRWRQAELGRVLVQTDIRQQQTPQGWLPAGWTTTFYDRDGKGNITLAQHVRVTALTINPKVESTDFDIAGNPGMLVLDAKNQRTYRTGSDGRTLIEVQADSGQPSSRAWLALLAMPVEAVGLLWFLVLLRRLRRDRINRTGSGTN